MVAVREMSRSLAKVAVAVVFTGPVGGLQEAAAQAIELFAGNSGPTADTLTRLLTDLEVGLTALARSEHVPDDVVERALANARLTVERHGLTASELVDAGLDPQRAVAVVLARSDGLLRQLDEADEALCRRAVEQVYGTLVRHAATLPDLTAEYRQTVLHRLESLDSLPAAVRTILIQARAHTLLVDPARHWFGDRYSSSALLRPEYRVVPFWGREEILADLTHWVEAGHTVATRLYTAVGGMGKTRLMMEACSRLRAAGWRAGFLAEQDERVTAEQLAILGHGVRGVAIVVDYCETRVPMVGRVIGAALAASTQVRIVLLARSTAEWWSRLRQLPDAVGDHLGGPATSVRSLPSLTQDQPSRDAMFSLAVNSFGHVLGRSTETAPPLASSTARQTYERVLFVLIKALAVVNGAQVDGERQLLDYTLGREQRFWDEELVSQGLGLLAGRPIRQAAAVATLAGQATTYTEAVNLLSTAPLLRDQPAATVGRMAELLHRLYPAERWLNGVQPDLLGEHLVARVIEEDPDVLGVFGGP